MDINTLEKELKRIRREHPEIIACTVCVVGDDQRLHAVKSVEFRDEVGKIVLEMHSGVKTYRSV